jgi:hypothetical protein
MLPSLRCVPTHQIICFLYNQAFQRTLIPFLFHLVGRQVQRRCQCRWRSLHPLHHCLRWRERGMPNIHAACFNGFMMAITSLNQINFSLSFRPESMPKTAPCATQPRPCTISTHFLESSRSMSFNDLFLPVIRLIISHFNRLFQIW